MATYYVAKTGSDSNTGAINSNWLTIQHALDYASLTSGDKIYVYPGSYPEQVTVNDAGITLQKWPGKYGRVVVDGIGRSIAADDPYSVVSNPPQIYIKQSNVTIKGFDCINSPGYGIMDLRNETSDTNLCTGTTLINCRAFDNYLSGIALNGYQCVATDCESAYNFDFGVYAPHSRGVACTFSDSGGELLITKSDHGYSLTGDNNIPSKVIFTNSGGNIPATLSLLKSYYFISGDTDTFKISETQGGSAIAYDGTASGTTHVQDCRGAGTDADGFSIDCISSTLTRCYSHHNADDGFDAYYGSSNTLINCKSSYNGFRGGARTRSHATYANIHFSGDGNGFKMGRGGKTTPTLSNARWDAQHMVKNCAAWGNVLANFTNNEGGNNTWINCTSSDAKGLRIDGTTNGTPQSRAFWNFDKYGGSGYDNNDWKNCLSVDGITHPAGGDAVPPGPTSTPTTNYWQIVDKNLVPSTNFVSVYPNNPSFLKPSATLIALAGATDLGYGTTLGWVG